MAQTVQKVKTVEDYPLILTVNHICEILSISKPTAYELFKRKDFPALPLPGRIRRVQRDAFFRWLEETKGDTA
ncbi:helix-turn-helix domain-containing protein [Aneurinibacillus thermoaerophilus]|uniref:helix-turn-helix domain-containing protein n=1 Tax=Aneurinibacillus thermoaerophilus TaxID=143495 RepID=UPI002E1E5E7E|nr:helix-turn-helix domain-containing protein [Aneurinibacillus thermoaerophilus]MED0762714.1 helix-turn-helix domain-containing protein [Aneurinibacillus thermoaerophilus]